jgi:probable phosphoglycerate mutase
VLTLHFIRHGETDWNRERRVQGRSESSLTELGQKQATALHAQVHDWQIDQVYVSSAVRTRQTASHLLQDLQLPVQYRDSLREIYLGPWEARLWQEIGEQDPQRYDDFHHQPHLFELPGAETFHALQQRGVDAVNEIIAAQSDGKILVVSHGALLKAMLLYYLDQPLSCMRKPPGLDNCSHSVLTVDKSGATQVIKMGNVPVSEIAWLQQTAD